MPFTCAIDMERRLVIVTASDHFTFTDLRVIQVQLTHEPHFNLDFDLLTDPLAA